MRFRGDAADRLTYLFETLHLSQNPLFLLVHTPQECCRVCTRRAVGRRRKVCRVSLPQLSISERPRSLIHSYQIWSTRLFLNHYPLRAGSGSGFNYIPSESFQDTYANSAQNSASAICFPNLRNTISLPNLERKKTTVSDGLRIDF